MRLVNLWTKLRFEEKFLAVYSLASVAVFAVIRPPDTGYFEFIKMEINAFGVSLSFLQGAAIFAMACAAYLYLKKLVDLNFLSKSDKGLNVAAAKDYVLRLARYLGFFFFLTLGFSCFLLVLSGLTVSVQGRLVNETLMGWDRLVFGVYPFIWLHTAANPLKPAFDFISPLIIYSFQALSLLVGASFVFFFSRRRNSAEMVISFYLAMAMGAVFWFSFPVNSPNNFFLAAHADISGFAPNQRVLTFEDITRQNQKAQPPVTTFPSCHVMWGMVIVYLWAAYDKRTLFLTLPWFTLNVLGTVFLAQHYAVDALFALPLGLLAILIGRILTDRNVPVETT